MSGKHGTYAGLNEHKRDNEEPCSECYLAGMLYIRAYRRRKDLGMPMSYFHEAYAAERPLWTERAELADAALVGPVLDAAWRANA